jgi:DNA polymerase-3 subunit delta'
MSTIRSRCQTIRFAPVGESEIESFLVDEHSVSPDDAKLIARLSNGSVARALEFDIVRFRFQRDMQLGNIEKALVRSDRTGLLRASEQMNDGKNKELYEENLEILEYLVRDIWLIKSGELNLVRNFDLADRLEDISGRLERLKLVGTLKEIELIRQSFAVNINRRAATDVIIRGGLR